MLQPSKIAPEFDQHEELFLERYKRLLAWALQLTERDREHAEDLVHDTYIQFTLTRPDLSAIDNLNGYLYTMMRNLRVSQLRRSLRRQQRTISIIDYDSAEMGLRAADPHEQIKLQDALRQICQYACMRKQTAKAGSVLILRFLHGYYPREIAQVMRSTRQAVEERLRIARQEARQYLENPKNLRFICGAPAETVQVSRMGFVQTTDKLVSELRQTIFDSRQGDCLPRKQLEKLYRDNESSGIDNVLLAHLVSCPNCLDEVNRTLDLPPLCERFTTDTLGTDSRGKGGDGGGDEGGDGGGGPTGGASASERRECRRQAAAVSEHRPTELCISVNGYLMAVQKVRSELSEQTLSINAAEKIDFVEIFSGQDVRLLFLSVANLGNGTSNPTARVQLSDNRSLEATLSFGSPWPTLQVVYSDPLFGGANAQEDIAAATNEPRRLEAVANSQDQDQDSRKEPGLPRISNAVARSWRRFGSAGFWLRPGMITAVVALILITALLLTRLHVPTVSAAELLQRSTAADESVTGNAEVVTHRTINLEERRVKGGDLVARHRLEVWRSAAQGIRLRRVYDDQGALIAGEWTKADGTSTVYHRGAEPQARTSPEIAGKAILQTNEFWRLDASARDFKLLAGGPDAITVEETSDTFVLSYRSDPVSDSNSLLGATLILNRADLHAIEQTLTVLRDGEAHAYRFIEAGFERKATGSVAPSTLQPEPELLGSAERVKDSADSKRGLADESAQTASLIVNPSQALASPELEIEVTYLLNRIKANLGEQVSLTRTTGGQLRVEALVETDGRKQEFLQALGSVMNNPAVRVEVSTVDEAVKHQQARSKPSEATVREVEVSNNRIPADPQLRAYFSKRLVGSEAIDEEIKRYTNRTMNRSRQALLQASALKRLVRRFSPEEIQALTPEARTKWLAMIREHAQACQREVGALRRELGSVFGGPSVSTEQEAVSEANLTRVADRLVQLSYANDEAVRSAFTISAEGRTAAAIKSPQFWRALANAEALAEAIQSVYQK
jgi:RNA polymerase sigma factor (sigma-70 family)